MFPPYSDEEENGKALGSQRRQSVTARTQTSAYILGLTCRI